MIMNLEFERHGPDMIEVGYDGDGEPIIVCKIMVEAQRSSGGMMHSESMVWPESAADEPTALNSAFTLLEEAVTRQIENRARDAWMDRYRVGFGSERGLKCDDCGVDLTGVVGLALDIPYSLTGLVESARNHRCAREE